MRIERQILFSAPMVRALLDDRKTQTRRKVKLPHKNALGHWEATTIGGELGGRTSAGDEIPVQGAIWHTRTGDCLTSPYGQPSERIWVRETFIAYGRWETRFSPKKERDEWHFVDMTVECDRRYQYAADNPDVPLAKKRSGGALPGWYKRPAIFMPRAASRILLDITGVRVERLNDCSETDAQAEGCERLDSEREEHDWKLCPTCGGTRLHRALGPNGGVMEDVGCRDCDSYAKRYRHLWESINGAGSWAANPWVWVVDFRQVATNQTEAERG